MSDKHRAYISCYLCGCKIYLEDTVYFTLACWSSRGKERSALMAFCFECGMKQSVYGGLGGKII